MAKKRPAPAAKPPAIRRATEAEVRRLFMDLLKQRLPMAPDPVPPRPPESSQDAQDAQALFARMMLRVADKHDDPPCGSPAGQRLAKVAKSRP